MVLAGDIGGTKTVLALYIKEADGSTTCLEEKTFASREFLDFDDILTTFLPPGINIASACFGVAGPVMNQRCQTTNLPWTLDAAKLEHRLETSQVRLLNDLEAMALGMMHLPETDLLELNPNAQPQTGNKAVIAAGTGLGEAILFWDGTRHHPVATEGGHCDFAAHNAQQDQLAAYLRNLYPDHVSYERILSGIGFSHLYDFFRIQDAAQPSPDFPPLNQSPGEHDRNAIISRLGVTGKNPLCAKAVRLFVDIYGAEAGNLALKSLAIGGVYIGGGIAPKILAAMEDGRFMKAFSAKGRFSPLLDKIPVKMSLNPFTPLIGAIHYFG